MHDEAGSDPGALWALTTAAALYLPGVDHASIIVVGQRDIIRSPASTGREPRFLDKVQQRYVKGPGLDAVCEHQTRRVDDLSRETRWPNFTTIPQGAD